VNPTLRGFIIFLSVLLTIGAWAPLSNSPRLGPGGSTITETYFGVFRYGTLTARMKEPNYELNWTLHPGRLAASLALTGAFWGGIIFLVRRRKAAGSASDRTESQQL
jgi:hypothetical protein